MKVRLYRGPHDGKVVFLNDQETHLVLSETTGVDYAKALKDTNPIAAVGIVKTVYYRTKHTHPDGSVYFEWDKPKGTRTGLKRKPKRKNVVHQSGIYISGNIPANTITTTGSGYSIYTP